MAETALLPDAEALVAAWLRQHALVDANVYGSQLPAQADRDPAFPVVRVTRAPGGVVPARPAMWMDRPLLQVDCWAGERDDAFNLVTACMAALSEAPEGTHDLGVVSYVRFTLSPAWDPDGSLGDPAIPRYRFDAYVTVHPHGDEGT